MLEIKDESYMLHDLERSLATAHKTIDGACGRRFWADSSDQTRRYSSLSGDYIRIDDLHTLTSLKSDDGGDGTFENTWTENTDFNLEPLNAAADGKPWTAVRKHPAGSYSFSTSYPRTVELTGRFGWPSVPDPIREATLILASKLFKRKREAPFGIFTGGGIEGVAVRLTRTDPDIPMLISNYVRTGLPFR